MFYFAGVALLICAVTALAQDWRVIRVNPKDTKALLELNDQRKEAEVRHQEAEIIYGTYEDQVLTELAGKHPDKAGCRTHFSENFDFLIITDDCTKPLQDLLDQGYAPLMR